LGRSIPHLTLSRKEETTRRSKYSASSPPSPLAYLLLPSSSLLSSPGTGRLPTSQVSITLP